MLSKKSKIVSITKIKSIEKRYDITVEESSRYFANNILVHNTDGQNLMFSWKNGKLIGARNKGHLKNFGENALDIDGILSMFKGRGEIEIAFTSAMADLEKAINSLSDKNRDEVFKNGEKFASIEVITPRTQNVIPYGQNMLVLHGVITYNQEGEPIDNDKNAGVVLGKLIKEVNADIQDNFYIRGPQQVESMPLPNAKSLEQKFIGELNDIIKSAGIGWDASIGEYMFFAGKRKFEELLKADGVSILPTYIDNLVKRIFLGDKSYKAQTLKKDLGSAADWFINLEKTQGPKLQKETIKPIEYLFLQVGTTFLLNLKSFLSVTPTEATVEMRQEIEQAINDIRKSNDTAKIEKMNKELERIAAVGGLDAIVPSEGVTFVWKGKHYKYTGIFAPINQLRGMIVYNK